MARLVDGVYDEKTFFAIFALELRQARGLVLIHCPFVSVRRILTFKDDLLESIHRGVRICAFVQEPSGLHEDTPANIALRRPFEAGVELLRSCGVHVTIRPKVHSKVMVVDDHVLWDGSLNILSHRDTSERFTRTTSRSKAHAAIRKHELYSCTGCASQPALRFFGKIETQLAVIGRRIARNRLERGVSQRQVAERLGIRQAALSEIESGKRNVKVMTLLQVAASLGLELQVIPWYHSQALDERIDNRPAPTKRRIRRKKKRK